ncbi:hypothetical protein [Rhodococcoides navarretei]|uniref:Uncharacterized protein n=1 Tax=Rhodococcus navarretei TaxID=3128981 RepID=A0ABU9CTC4_9NOCA
MVWADSWPQAVTFVAASGQFLSAVSGHIHGRLWSVFHGRRQAFTPAADDAIRVAAQNGALLPGSVLPKLGQLASKGLPLTGAIGQKIPIAGVVVTSLQTAHDLRDAEDFGDATKVVAKDAGGFLAGTAATTLLLGSAAGGPATVAAVGVGILVAYGVGELIEAATD